MEQFTNITFFSLFSLFQRMAKWSDMHNGKFPDPYAKIKLEKEEKKEKKKKKKKQLLRERNSQQQQQQQQQQQIDSNGNKVKKT